MYLAKTVHGHTCNPNSSISSKPFDVNRMHIRLRDPRRPCIFLRLDGSTHFVRRKVPESRASYRLIVVSCWKSSRCDRPYRRAEDARRSTRIVGSCTASNRVKRQIRHHKLYLCTVKITSERLLLICGTSDTSK